MQITARESGGDRDLVLAGLCPEALVSDLAEALWPRSPSAAGLTVDGAVVHRDLSLEEPGLVHGSVGESIDSHGHCRQQGTLALLADAGLTPPDPATERSARNIPSRATRHSPGDSGYPGLMGSGAVSDGSRAPIHGPGPVYWLSVVAASSGV